MLAGCAGTAVVAAQVDDIGAGFGNPNCNHANGGYNRAFYCDAGVGVDYFQFFDELGQVFDGIQVVVIGW